MKKLSFKSIKSRLTFWFLAIALLPLLVALVVTYTQRVNVIETRTFDKLTAIRDLKVNRLKDWLGERAGDMSLLSRDAELKGLENIINKDNKNQNAKNTLDEIRNYLIRYMNNSLGYEEMFIINSKTGIILVSTSRNSEGNDKSKDKYFTEPLESRELFIKDIYYSKTLLKNSMVYSIPIFCVQHGGEHITGILATRVDLHNSLYKMLLDRVGLGKTGETLIVNKDVVALNELRWFDNAPLNLQISAETAVNAAQGKTGITVTTDYRGEEILAAYTYIPETGWGFVCKQDLYELNAPIREMVLNFVILFIISAGLIYLVAFFISKTISKPIIEMDVKSKKIKTGDFSIRNTINSEDELGSLAVSINEMTDSIENRIKIQKGVRDISETIIGQSSMQDFGTELLIQLVEITGSNMSTFYILNELTSEFEHFFSIGANEDMLKSFKSENPQGEFGNALSKKSIYYLQDIPEDTIFKFQTTAGDAIPKEIITIPILVENIVVALISLVNIYKFATESYDILEQSWLSINTSYSNLIANERTRIMAENLAKANQHLEAQTEELQEQSEELQSQTEELQQTSEELQEQNVELEMQRKQVEEANRLKSEFLSNMSHELRTPLNSILALSRVLIMQAKNKLSKEENSYLEIVERNGKQLLALINDILDLSKIEAGKMDITPTDISIGSILNDVKENLKPLAVEKGLTISLQVPGKLPLVEADEAKLHQVFSNIIGNSIKFTKKGKVGIKVKSDSEHVYIEVKDTGIGIAQEALHHIFDEFRQVDGSSSRQYEGTGLGLAISYKLIKILGGDIDVKSALGEGSAFTITLPIKWQGEVDYTESTRFQSSTPQSPGKTILVVDDDAAVVKEISGYLEKSGYNPLGTTLASKVLDLAKEHQPFAITLDVVMPEMDGWEVLQKLKGNEKTKNIPIIVISISDDREIGFALGAVGYIQKPLDKKLLIAEINRLHENPKTIMIVDDNDMDRRRMAEILEEENMATIIAEDGSKCFHLLKEQMPDVLVLDLLMPGMDGFQVLDNIRKEAKTRDLPVIIVTAKDLTKEDKLKLRDKVSSILTKSDVTPLNLFVEIKRILTELEKHQNGTIKKKDKSEMRLLLVEDNESAVIQVKSALAGEGYNIDVTTGGMDALDYLKHTVPDGIILDLMMPEVDGFEVLEKMRSAETTKNIPVLILTAKDLSKTDLSRLSANNIQQLIHKGDVDKEGLLFKVKTMVGIVSASDLKSKDRIIEQIDKSLDPKTISQQKKKISPKTGLLNVLVVEDNPDNMTIIKAILKSKFNIREARDGEDGLNKAIGNLPDIILLDMSLPKMDGIEVVKILKSREDTKNIPVIALTASAMKEDKEKFLNAGCDDFFAKPVEPEMLLSMLDRWLGEG